MWKTSYNWRVRKPPASENAWRVWIDTSPKKICVDGKWIASLLLEVPADIASLSATTVWTMLCCYCHYVSTESPYQGLLSSSCWQWRAGTIWTGTISCRDQIPGKAGSLRNPPPTSPSSEQYLTATKSRGPGFFYILLMLLLPRNRWDRPAAWCRCLSTVQGVRFWTLSQSCPNCHQEACGKSSVALRPWPSFHGPRLSSRQTELIR